jgi:hypothetical protein
MLPFESRKQTGLSQQVKCAFKHAKAMSQCLNDSFLLPYGYLCDEISFSNDFPCKSSIAHSLADAFSYSDSESDCSSDIHSDFSVNTNESKLRGFASNSDTSKKILNISETSSITIPSTAIKAEKSEVIKNEKLEKVVDVVKDYITDVANSQIAFEAILQNQPMLNILLLKEEIAELTQQLSNKNNHFQQESISTELVKKNTKLSELRSAHIISLSNTRKKFSSKQAKPQTLISPFSSASIFSILASIFQSNQQFLNSLKQSLIIN